MSLEGCGELLFLFVRSRIQGHQGEKALKKRGGLRVNLILPKLCSARRTICFEALNAGVSGAGYEEQSGAKLSFLTYIPLSVSQGGVPADLR